nr:3-demethylubiquinone-9 3-methyltransferase [uncultured bacterium]
MQTQLNPYINFKDTTKQAMEFYQSIFGGALDLNYFKEYNFSEDASEDNKVMHAILKGDNAITFMAADTPNSMGYNPGANISLSLNGDNLEELTTYFNALTAQGQVLEPLEKAPWGDYFGMCIDQFGIKWMVNVSQAQ